MVSFKDKIVLVTGAASGIGRTTAQHFAAAGATVIVSDVDEKGGKETVDMITGDDGTAVFKNCDVSDEASVKALIDMIKDNYGRLDIAYNNAGIVGKFEHVHEKSVADFDKVIAINLRGVFLCMKYEIPLMLEAGGGAIVNTSSTAGLVAVPGLIDYAASKHAVVGMTKVAATEYAQKGIRVNAIHPGGVETSMTANMNISEAIMPLMQSAGSPTPMQRMANTDEIAQAVLWLCSDEAAYVTGASLPIDGGLTAI